MPFTIDDLSLPIFHVDSDGKPFVGISMHAIGLEDSVDYAVGAVTISGFEKTAEVNPMHKDYVVIAISGYNGAFSGFSAELDGRINEYGLRPDGKNYTWTRDLCPARIYIGVKGYLENGALRKCLHILACLSLMYQNRI